MAYIIFAMSPDEVELILVLFVMPDSDYDLGIFPTQAYS